jgi:hypothetical protein
VFAAKWQEEVFERELMTRLASDHVENSGRFFGEDEPICALSIDKNHLDPLKRKGSALFRNLYLNQISPWLNT